MLNVYALTDRLALGRYLVATRPIKPGRWENHLNLVLCFQQASNIPAFKQ